MSRYVPFPSIFRNFLRTNRKAEVDPKRASSKNDFFYNLEKIFQASLHFLKTKVRTFLKIIDLISSLILCQERDAVTLCYIIESNVSNYLIFKVFFDCHHAV